MSVSAIIINPINQDEKSLNIPISSETLFQKEWLPIIEKLNLKWLKCFESGLEIYFEDLKYVTVELETMKNWILENYNNENGKFIVARIIELTKRLKSIFNNNNAIVFIG